MSSKKEKSEELALVSTEETALATYAPELLGGESLTLIDELDGVWAKDPGSTIVGEITHAYAWEGEAAWVHGVAVRLRLPAKVVDTPAPRVAPADSIVGITLSAKLDALRYLRPGDVVAVTFLGEVKLAGGHRAHQFRVRASARPQSTPMRDGSPANADAF